MCFYGCECIYMHMRCVCIYMRCVQVFIWAWDAYIYMRCVHVCIRAVCRFVYGALWCIGVCKSVYALPACSPSDLPEQAVCVTSFPEAHRSIYGILKNASAGVIPSRMLAKVGCG